MSSSIYTFPPKNAHAIMHQLVSMSSSQDEAKKWENRCIDHYLLNKYFSTGEGSCSTCRDKAHAFKLSIDNKAIPNSYEAGWTRLFKSGIINHV